ncbi:MAG: hypothetical protein ABI430_00810 [Candidatus Taylorbacteria bacterium]
MSIFKRSRLRSKKYAKKKRKFFWIKIIFLIILCALLIYSLSYLSKLQQVAISDITVEGNSAVTEDDILSLVEGELDGSYYEIFSKRNIFIYPKRLIEEKMKDTWKRIDSVKIERVGLSALAISVTEKKAMFLWCGEKMSAEVKVSDCFFMDDTGYVFSKAPLFSENVYFRFFGAIAESDPIGSQYLPLADFQKVSGFIKELENNRISATRLLSKGGGEYEVVLSDNNRVLVNEREAFAKTVEHLKTLLESDSFKKDVKNSPTNIDYIDLRFGNRVFYKFK